MKFNCGLSYEEKRELEREKLMAAFVKITRWHRWFAWYPVRVASGDCRWLEYVERRAEVQNHYFRDWHCVSEYKTVNYPKWEYRAIDLNND